MYIVLENMQMDHTGYDHTFHASRLMYMTHERSRAERQAEWLSRDLMDFVVSETGRGPINWDHHLHA